MAPSNQPTEPIFNSAGDLIGENDTQATGDTGQADSTETEQTGEAGEAGEGSSEPDPGTDGEGDGSAGPAGATDPPPPEGDQPGQHDDDETKKQLYERATELEIDGRSTMTKEQLIEAINQAEKDASAETETETDPPADEPEPEPEAIAEPELTDEERFDQAHPDFHGWFARVQKTAQFNGRPIPEPSEKWQQAYRDRTPPADAANKLGLPKA